jgi:hypothetical protein
MSEPITVPILGAHYCVRVVTRCKEEEERYPYDIYSIRGYCDFHNRSITVFRDEGDKRLSEHTKECLRHEIIHAFFFESGLGDNFFAYKQNEETYADWIALQFPKILTVFKACKCT